ncbi:hypothetical protein EVAR_72785_1 [Eumeta japonica]|uniref:Uncharacterized protein n=1 Tax=Eumeta variegata TaxID=151549 RepID=A0A4C1SYS6_EUMVA|nr:hypothetical protein EVAR_72785_1 [Eumeta japonica]
MPLAFSWENLRQPLVEVLVQLKRGGAVAYQQTALEIPVRVVASSSRRDVHLSAGRFEATKGASWKLQSKGSMYIPIQYMPGMVA